MKAGFVQEGVDAVSHRDNTQLIRQLFQPEFAESLLLAGEPERERLLKSAIRMSIENLPPICREIVRHDVPDDDELRIAQELRDYKMPLMDGTAIEMGLPYDWTYGVDDGHLGGKAPKYIVPRIAFVGILVRAYQHTGDREYAEALRNYIVDYVSRFWVDSTELPERENWLCTACRCGAWDSDRFAGLYAALTCPEVVECFSFDDLLIVFRAIDNMMTGLIPNLALGSNWRVFELSNIFTQGICYPFLKNSSGWRELAANGLNEEFDIQFRDDGSHEELAVHYAAGVWCTFAAYYMFAVQAPDAGLCFDRDKMERCLEYFLSTCKPFGLAAALGDDYASRSTQMLDGISSAHPKDEPPKWNDAVRKGAELLASVEKFPAADFILQRTAKLPWTSRHHRDSGYMFMRDGWESDSLYANFNMGYYANCHCHFGLLGIELAGYGREFVVDPGCSALDTREVNQNFGRTRAHSTMCVDGLDQQVTVPVQASRCFTAEHYDFAVGVYKGGYRSGNAYGPGTTSAEPFDSCFSGTHFRHVLFVKDGYWIVFDALNTRPGHIAETRFQFLPNVMRTLPGGGYATGWKESNLALLPLHWDDWAHDIFEGETDPIEGWMPAPGGDLISAPVYKATRPTNEGTLWHGTLMFPYRSADMPRVEVTPLPVDGAGFTYRIDTDSYTDYLFLSNSWHAADVNLEGVRSNAPLVHLRYVDGKLIRGCTCEGTYLEADGQNIFHAPGTMLAREFVCTPTLDVKSMQPRK